MANLCMTDIEIICDEKEAAEFLLRKLDSWCREFDATPFEEIVEKSGIGTAEKFNCRGSVDCFGVGVGIENTIEITTSTAWLPITRIWLAICEKYLTENGWGYCLFYEGFEPCCDVFYTNDTTLVGTRVYGRKDLWEYANENEWD